MADGSPRPHLINVYWGIFTWFPSGSAEWGEWNAPEQTALGLSQLAAAVKPLTASMVPYDGNKATMVEDQERATGTMNLIFPTLSFVLKIITVYTLNHIGLVEFHTMFGVYVMYLFHAITSAAIHPLKRSASTPCVHWERKAVLVLFLIVSTS